MDKSSALTVDGGNVTELDVVQESCRAQETREIYYLEIYISQSPYSCWWISDPLDTHATPLL